MTLLENKKTYWNPYFAGTCLGFLLFLSYFILGHGLGASGGLVRVVVTLEDSIAPHHVDRTSFWAKLAGGDQNPLDHWLVWSIAGILLGGSLSGILGKRFFSEIQKGPQISNKKRLHFAFIGGILIGYGAQLARGCTSGQALSGGAVLSVGSWAFMFSVFAGGYLIALPFRKLWK